MKNYLLLALSVFAFAGAACAVEADEADETVKSSSPANLAETSSLDETAAPAALDEIPAELSLISAQAVPVGCSPTVTCVGTKTCSAWSSYTACAPRYTACTDQCGFPTRSGCVSPGTFEPQNRTRTCVMSATGQTCVETSYRLLTVSCPYGG